MYDAAAEGPRLLREAACEHCGSAWRETYALSGYTDLEPGLDVATEVALPVPPLDDREFAMVLAGLALLRNALQPATDGGWTTENPWLDDVLTNINAHAVPSPAALDALREKLETS